MFVPVDERLFRARVPAPEDENDVFAPVADELYNAVGEPRPAAILVRVGAVRPHGECRIQKEHALLCPFRQIPAARDGTADVGVQFLEDIDERGRRLRSFAHGKAQSVRLSLVVIGVLSEQHDFHFIKRRQLETIENIVHIGIYDVVRVFLFQKIAYFFIIFAFEQRRERLVPTAAELDHACASCLFVSCAAISSSVKELSRAK